MNEDMIHKSPLDMFYLTQIERLQSEIIRDGMRMEIGKTVFKIDGDKKVEVLMEYDQRYSASGVYFGCRVENGNSIAQKLVDTIILEFKNDRPNYVPLEDDGSSENGSEWLVWYRVKDDDIQQGLEDLNKLKELFKAHGFTESALV